ncbi:MAG TPA: DUF3027 domain-containing protein [Mycobacteriales bacterium]|nr:DUF3027 domain-containing protein [Mycobacteriales bacterium]
MPTSSATDRVLVDAVDLARAVAVEVGGLDVVGEHEGVDADGERLLTHYFACLDRAYRGWRWSVTVSRASRGKTASVDEVVLLPGPEALLAPEWLPWQERLRPGDLGVGDLLPTAADDPRLVPAFFDVSDDDVDQVAFELGLGRPRVLSPEGRDLAATRWHEGAAGPDAPIAKAVAVPCATCGFFLPLAGPLRQAFGACGNGYAPDDGRVVAVDHGCGAHSEVVVVTSLAAPPPPLLDEFGVDPAAPEHAVGSVTDTDSAEPLGHS